MRRRRTKVIARVLVRVCAGESWWKSLGRLRYSSIEVTIDGVVYEAVKSIDFETAKHTVERGRGRLKHLKHEGHDWIARPKLIRGVPVLGASNALLPPNTSLVASSSGE